MPSANLPYGRGPGRIRTRIEVDAPGSGDGVTRLPRFGRRTASPAGLAKLISASRLNLSMRPRIKSFKHGCVRPSRRADATSAELPTLAFHPQRDGSSERARIWPLPPRYLRGRPRPSQISAVPLLNPRRCLLGLDVFRDARLCWQWDSNYGITVTGHSFACVRNKSGHDKYCLTHSAARRAAMI